MRVARSVRVSRDQAEALKELSRRLLPSPRIAQRARIVLLAASGLRDKQIAKELGIRSETAARWRNRFLDGGITALEKDAPRRRRHRTITEGQIERVVAMTIHCKSSNTNHWTARTVAAAAGISDFSVRRIWRENGIQPQMKHLDSRK
jgi:transposase